MGQETKKEFFFISLALKLNHICKHSFKHQSSITVTVEHVLPPKITISRMGFYPAKGDPSKAVSITLGSGAYMSHNQLF